MASAGQPLREEEVISYVLAGLDADYNSLVASITVRVQPFSLRELFAHILSFEITFDQQNSNAQFPGSSVNIANRGSHVGRGRGRGHGGGRDNRGSGGQGEGRSNNFNRNNGNRQYVRYVERLDTLL